MSVGAPARIRTADTLITNQVLCLLSYKGMVMSLGQVGLWLLSRQVVLLKPTFCTPVQSFQAGVGNMVPFGWYVWVVAVANLQIV